MKWEIFPNSLNAFAQIASPCLHYRSQERPTIGTYENKEYSNFSTEQQEVIDAGNCEVLDDGNEEEKSDEISMMVTKRSRLMRSLPG